jgi:hypothetical protein
MLVGVINRKVRESLGKVREFFLRAKTQGRKVFFAN